MNPLYFSFNSLTDSHLNAIEWTYEPSALSIP